MKPRTTQQYVENQIIVYFKITMWDKHVTYTTGVNSSICMGIVSLSNRSNAIWTWVRTLHMGKWSYQCKQC